VFIGEERRLFEVSKDVTRKGPPTRQMDRKLAAAQPAIHHRSASSR